MWPPRARTTWVTATITTLTRTSRRCSCPAQYSVTGQTLNWDPSGPSGPLPAGYTGGVSNSKYLQRYYGGSLAACKDPNYISLSNCKRRMAAIPAFRPGCAAGRNGIANYSDDLNTEYDALQITLAQSMWKGLAFNVNYQWASAFDEQRRLLHLEQGHGARARQQRARPATCDCTAAMICRLERASSSSPAPIMRRPVDRRLSVQHGAELGRRTAVHAGLQQLRWEPGLQP